METEVKSSAMGEVLPYQFRFYYDAHHGWLEVSHVAIRFLNLSKVISNSSHVSEKLVYLEEDLDAPIFIRAYLKHIGKPGDHKYFHECCLPVYDGEVSKIRSFTRYDRCIATACQNSIDTLNGCTS